MTTPNVEELITDLQELANEIEISYHIEAIEEAVKALQSQAERIVELEKLLQNGSEIIAGLFARAANMEAERDTLRAELAAIAATEPVAKLMPCKEGWFIDLDNPPPITGETIELFTHPMPASTSSLPERDTSKPVEAQGLFHKFNITRTDGSHQPGGKHYGCEYFVLDVAHDPHAKSALQAYAAACAQSHPQLSADLIAKHGPMPAQDVNAEFVRVIQFAISQDSSASDFLNGWLHGDTDEWPEFTNAKGAK